MVRIQIQHPPIRIGGVQPSEEAEHLGIHALDAQAQPVHPGLDPWGQVLRPGALGIALEGYLGGFGEQRTQVPREPVGDGTTGRRSERGRGPATEVDAREPMHTEVLAHARELHDHALCPAVEELDVAIHEAGEMTVRAAHVTKGDVHVERDLAGVGRRPVPAQRTRSKIRLRRGSV